MSQNTAKVIEINGNENSAEDNSQMLAAVTSSFAYIEFTPDGKILSANEHFLHALGYELDEIVGKHHRMFVDPKEAKTPEYGEFWDALRRGEAQSRQFKRMTHSGEPLWIQASYIPVKNGSGKVVKVVKLAQNINSQKIETFELAEKIAAVSKTQAMIEFDLDGIVVDANANFIKTLGYSSLNDIKGKHHRIFCDPEYSKSAEYAQFWDRLRSGDAFVGEYKRVTRDGKDIWIQASYNPIPDLDGKPCKVVKFASDITQNKTLGRFQQMTAMSPVNTMMADLDGTILYMNAASESTLKSLQHLLPVSVDKIVGQSFDVFHKNPAHQRKLIANPDNFPLTTKIKLGEETLELIVAAIRDPEGKYMGPMVNWTIITEKLKIVEALEEASSNLSAASSELSASAAQMTANAEKTSQESASAASAAEEVSAGVQTVATNTEEMAASIKEIARSANESAEMSKETLQSTVNTNKSITQLGVSSQEIGNVIKVISSIAQQTNLLALNATIEAARAGDAGKGFAVVANEVKELAKQTAKATEEITSKIGGIQTESQGAVEAIGQIAQAVEKLNGIAGSIAASVEEQTATTSEVARVVQESSRGVEGIASTIKVVQDGAAENSTSAGQLLEAANGLSGLADRLKKLVSEIKV